MAAGKAQQRRQVGHRIAVDAVAGQGVEHVQKLVAVVLHRPEAAPAGHPGDETTRRLSFGGIGAPEGWTTVIARSPLGRAVLADARGTDLEQFNMKDDPQLAQRALGTVLEWSDKKKAHAQAMHQELEKSVQVKG